jgi:hypothetical protein
MIGARTLCAVGVIVAGSGCGDSRQDSRQEPTEPKLASIRELMDSLIDPSADVVWGVVGTITDEDGVHELAPQTPEEWANVRRAAIRISEGVLLLLVPGRRVAHPGQRSIAPGVELEPEQIDELIQKNRETFVAFARSLQGIGAEAVQASDAKNAAALLELGGRMEAICEGCQARARAMPARPFQRSGSIAEVRK